MGAVGRLGWDELRDLLAVVEAGSLSAAARALGVSQSTMSRRMAAIEARGLALFADGAGPDLTPLGRELVATAAEMRAAFSRAEAALGAAPPPVHVAACEVTARLFVADLIPDWSRAAAGGVDLAVHDDLFALKPGSFDVMVSPFDAPPPAPAVRLGALDWALFASPDYLAARGRPDAGRGLAGHRVIGASGSLVRFGVYDWLAGLGGETVLRASSPLAHFEACARGQGIALLPRQLAAGDPRLIEVALAEPGPSEVWMVPVPDRASLPRVAAFLRWVARRVRRSGT
jgi:DNA-binding transcriptional LysR family regulator